MAGPEDPARLEAELARDGVLVLDKLDEWAVSRGDRTFIYYGEEDRSISFAEMDRLCSGIAGGLRQLGVGAGDRVALLLTNPLVGALSMFALWRVGAVYCPINYSLTGRLLGHQLRDLNPRLVIGEESLLAQLATVAEVLAGPDLVVHRPARDDHDFDPAVSGITAEGCRTVCGFAELLAAGGDGSRAPQQPADLANILYTSGTTGPSKGVLQSHRWMNQFSYSPRCLIDCDDVVYNDLPLYHAAGAISNVVRAAWVGCEVAIWDRFSARDYWRRIARRGATTAILIDVMISRLVAAPEKPDDAWNTLHCVNLTPLPERHHELALRFGLDICATAYGQTETGLGALGLIDQFPNGGGTPPDLYRGRAKEEMLEFARRSGYPIFRGDREIRKGLMGAPSIFVEAAILGPNDDVLPPEHYGQLAFRPRLRDLFTSGYWGRPEATAALLANGWLHTGDAAVMDGDGLLYFADRMGSFIRCKGENISSHEIEELVAEHPDISLCAAVGVPAREGDEEEVAVFAVTRPGADVSAEELGDWLHGRVPRHMRPGHVRLLDDLPRTPTNKVEKYRLRDSLLVELGMAPAGAGR